MLFLSKNKGILAYIKGKIKLLLCIIDNYINYI
jgi:hypothetical protein